MLGNPLEIQQSHKYGPQPKSGLGSLRLRRSKVCVTPVTRVLVARLRQKLSDSVQVFWKREICGLKELLKRVKRIRSQQLKDKTSSTLYMHQGSNASAKGKVTKPHAFGVNASIAVTNKSALMVSAKLSWQA